jgi:molybdopterin/thiamine biosynthesis adenylyltransferase
MTCDLVITEELFAPLHAQLFQPDRDEHAAVILAGLDRRGDRLRLLARELHLVPREEFPPGDHGYRQTSPRFVAERALSAGTEGLAYLGVHSHPSARRCVSLSSDDLAGHERLFPHLLNLTGGALVGGLVLGHESAAGEIWLAGGERQGMSSLTVIGDRLRRLTPAPRSDGQPDPRFDRQARLFGAAGQEILRSLHVAVVGAGGGGSMLVEQLAHLGVGELTVIDFDVVKEVNLSRIVGSVPTDVGAKKVAVLERLVTRIDPTINFHPVDGDIADLDVAQRLLDCDFIFLATDTITSRLVFNAIVHRYLIPGIQIGAKVDLDDRGDVSQVYVAVRPVVPDRGCLDCNSMLDPMALQQEARSDEERRAQNYLSEPDVVDPSVISLNGLGASHAVNVMFLWATGLAQPTLLDHRLFLATSGEALAVTNQKRPDCLFCSDQPGSMYATGGPPEQLPCRRRPRAAHDQALRRQRRFRRLIRRTALAVARRLRR